MPIPLRTISAEQMNALLQVEESHFIDLKSIDIAPSGLTKTAAAFCNTSGGELFIGIEEIEGEQGKQRNWTGFTDQEAANAHVQVLENMSPLGNHYDAEFLGSTDAPGLVLHLTMYKTKEIVAASNGKIYVRRSAQNLPVDGEVAIERLKYDKGIKSFEDELTNTKLEDIANSITILEFLLDVVPSAEPDQWLAKQQVLVDGRPTVAGV